MSEEEEKQATEQPAVLTATNTRDLRKEEEESLLRRGPTKPSVTSGYMRSHTIYTRKNALYTIPVIIISTITGTANFAQERFSEEQKPYVAMTMVVFQL